MAPNNINRSRFFVTAFFLVLLISILAVYSPGLSGDFQLDDNPHIVQNTGIQISTLKPQQLWEAAWSEKLRPFSMLTFALNYYFSGLDPFAYKLTNVIIHLLNTLTLSLFAYLLLSAYRERIDVNLPPNAPLALALTATAIWALHPINLTSVLYVVQRMTSLAAFFTLWGLIFYLYGRPRLDKGKHGSKFIIIGLVLFGGLALLNKENAVLLPVLMLATEVSIFRFESQRKSERLFLYGFFTATVAVPLILLAAYVLTHPERLQAAYELRNFTMQERLLTQARVLWFYLWMIIAPDNSRLTLYHDDFPISTSLFVPLTTLFSLTGILALVGIAFWVLRKWPLLSFGLLWFFIGHSIESSFIGLEIAYEHRNYLPTFGIILPLVFYGWRLLSARFQPKTCVTIAAVTILLLGFSTTLRAQQWGGFLTYNLFEVLHHPHSSRANYEAGRAYGVLLLGLDQKTPETLKKYYFDQARHYFVRSYELDKNSTSALHGLLFLHQSNGYPTDPSWFEELKNRLAQPPFEPGNTTALKILLSWQAEGTTHLSRAQVEGLFQAALSNPKVNNADKALLQLLLSSYYANQTKDIMKAVDYAHQATLSNPGHPAYNYHFAKLLILAGAYEGAAEQLAITRKKDWLGAYQSSIDSVERILKQRMANPVKKK